jgi:hypothetical protein
MKPVGRSDIPPLRKHANNIRACAHVCVPSAVLKDTYTGQPSNTHHSVCLASAAVARAPCAATWRHARTHTQGKPNNTKRQAVVQGTVAFVITNNLSW